MGCFNPIPIYPNPPFAGIRFSSSAGDGYSVNLEYYRAISPRIDYSVVYNVYYSSNQETVFNEGVKFVIVNDTPIIIVRDLIPGDVYYFAVRASSQPINVVNLAQLPSMNGTTIYPEAQLLQDISETDTIIPISDADIFPSYGIIKVGVELIAYTGVDIVDSTLISAPELRGYFDTDPRIHTTDGYDGYVVQDPIVQFFKGFEEQNTSIMLEENNFSPFKYKYTAQDGYMEKDLTQIYGDSSASDCLNENFKKYSFSGYRRTRPEDYINGKVSTSYFGGEHYCADGYGSVGGRIRGLTVGDIQNQREEVLLETYGRPMVLLRRQISGKVSKHYNNKKENTIHRGLDTYGTDMVLGYEQFINTRRSDGRILVRFDPTVEDIERTETGLENKFKPNAWTLSYPTINDGDVLIAFNRDGTEEFRYEIINVTRNTTFGGTDGRQIFSAVRVRKTDPIAQFKVIYDTSLQPRELSTSIGLVGGIVEPHIHVFTVPESIIQVGQINQTTSIAAGHAHVIENGEIVSVLDHTHSIIFTL